MTPDETKKLFGYGETPQQWFTGGFGNDAWNPIDFLIPGFSLMNKTLDLTGSSAAQSQYQNQLSLNQQNQAYNSAEAEKQRQWEEMMSSTEMQRRVKDLEAAGLNPYLALGSLGGASVGSGSAASSSPGSADMANNKIAQAAGILAVILSKIFAKK